MLILWPPLQPPQHRACLELSLLKICVNLLRWRKRWSIFIKLEWDLARWTLSCYSLRRISCPRRSPRLTRYEERLLNFGYPRTKVIQALFFEAIFTIHTPWGIRATFGGVRWKDLWKLHRRQILVSQSPYSGILVADHVEGSTRICEEVWPMTKFALNIHQPGGVLNPLSSPWPFAQ